MFRGMFQLGVEVAIVCGAGCIVGLAYNSLRDNPIRIHKNYFERPRAVVEPPVSPPSAGESVISASSFEEFDTNGVSIPAEPVESSSDYSTFQAGTFDEELGVFTISYDSILPLYEAGRDIGTFLFIDARDDGHYQDGHLPGAIQIDHYSLDAYLPDALPYINMANHVVIYCTGGDCEDSLFVYQDLLDSGIPANKLLLYKGGYTEWLENGMEIEGEGL